MVALPPSMGRLRVASMQRPSTRSIGGGWLVLTAILSHFPELESDFELLGFGYNVNLMKDEMEAFWTRTHRPSKSLSWRVPLLATHSPPDDAGEE
jgi:hypothetical protein